VDADRDLYWQIDVSLYDEDERYLRQSPETVLCECANGGRDGRVIMDTRLGGVHGMRGAVAR
jgi:hypothetical protein